MLTVVVNACVAFAVLCGCCCLLVHLARRDGGGKGRTLAAPPPPESAPRSLIVRIPHHEDEWWKGSGGHRDRTAPPVPSAPPPAPPATASAGAGTGGSKSDAATTVDRPASPVPDDVLRVFQWFQTGPMPLAIETTHLRQAHLALGIDVSGAQLVAALARYDVRQRGRLELAEFRTLIEQLRPLDEVLRIFKLIDRDHSGDIDAGELHIGCHLLGLDATDPQARELLNRFDKDRSGRIELDEFRKIVDQLRRFKVSQFDEVARVFHRFDRNHTHTIDTSELRQALYALGLVADQKETMAILNKYDANRDGVLEFDEFKRLVVELRNFHALGNDEVLRVFLAFDRDRSGSIDRRELAAALDELGLATDSRQAGDILSRYDTDNSGALELPEFRTLVGELRRFQAAAHASSGEPHDEIHQLFERYDTDYSGDIDPAELFRALNDLGLASSSSEAALILDKYDADRSRKLDLPEFRKVIHDLRAFHAKASEVVERVFRKFDADSSNSIESHELAAALYALGLQTDSIDASRILRKYDRDSNGRLDIGEFRALVADLRSFQFRRVEGGGYADDDAVHRVFARYDRDGSRSIDHAELRAALGALGLSTTSTQADAILRRYDRDRSGNLELAEFRELVFMLRRFQTGAPPSMLREPAPPAAPVVTPADKIHAMFAQHDRNGDGRLDAAELDEALYELGLATTTSEAAAILASFDHDRSRHLELAEFRALVDKVGSFKAQPAAPPLLLQPAAAAVPPPVGTGETVGQVFRRFDKDGSGDIDITELRSALNALGLSVDTAGAGVVLAKFDKDGSGRLEMNEFRALVKELKRFQGAPSAVATPRVASAAAATAPPPPPPAATGADVEAVFRRFDTDKSGDIDVAELRQALNALNLPVDTAAATKVLERFDSSRTGRLNYDEFVQLVNSLRSFQAGQPTHGD